VHYAVATAVAAGTNTRQSKHAGNNSRGENAASWRDMFKLSGDWCVQTGVMSRGSAAPRDTNVSHSELYLLRFVSGKLNQARRQ